MPNKETIVISLGGSVVVPELPDPAFIKTFRDLVLDLVQNHSKRFFIIVGGGKVSRKYQEALSKTIVAKMEDLDWIGIHATYLNAQLLRLSFGGKASEKVVSDPSIVSDIHDDIVIGAGWKPGFSTDMDAVLTAEKLNIKKIINISNTDYVYDSDPNVNLTAKKFDNLTWREYRSFIISDWKAGLNFPFDPVASKKAEELGMEVSFILASDLESLKNCIKNAPFTGTTIK